MQRGAAQEEIGHRMGVIDAGQDHPAPQHLRLVAAAAGVMLGGLFDDAPRRLQAGMAQ
jgi:hypothetical protein